MKIYADPGQFEAAWQPYEEKIQQVFEAAARTLALPDECACEMLIVDEAEIREINAENRNVDAATDVLSFPMLSLKEGEYGRTISWEDHQEDCDPETGDILLGDIVLCWPIMLRQGEEYAHGPLRECAFLLLHGLLHLLGYDHMTPDEEREMMSTAEEILNLVDIKR